LIFTAEAQRRGEDLGFREAAKTRWNFGFGRAEGAWIRIKMKIKGITKLGTED